MSELERVAAVAFYPIKGTHAATVDGEVPQSLPVGTTGFEVNGARDRGLVLFDPGAGVFVSQRGWDAGQRARFPDDRKLATVAIDVRSDHMAVTSAAGTLELPTKAGQDGERRTVDIFGKQLPAVDQGRDASRYFSSLLGREVHLLGADRGRPRVLPERYQRDGAFNIVAAADGMPFLLTNQASLAAAHETSGTEPGTVPIAQYRGNIVVTGEGLGPFGEDYLPGDKPFAVGEIAMWAVKPCSRCPVPNIDQQTGERGAGGLRVLRGRAGEIFTGETGVFFGMNLVHGRLGTISVGDEVVVPPRTAEPNITFRNAPTA